MRESPPWKHKMGERDDGLSLTLGLRLSLEAVGERRTSCMHERRTSLADFFPSRPGRGRGATGLDMNLFPHMESEGGEMTRGSSPNSGVSSVSGKRDEVEGEGEKTSCSRGSDEEDDGGGGSEQSRKKLRLSRDQSLLLEETFKEHSTLNPKQKQVLAKQLKLRPRQVEVWFQNRRARTKLKQTEVDCDYLKRCCDNLTKENRRLQKEVQELRALKFSSQFYMHMNPPTTLTMCPSCERVAVSSSSSAAATSAASTATKVTNSDRISPWAALPVPFL